MKSSTQSSFGPKKVLEFQSSKDHYKADACIVWCFDARFTPLYETFVKSRGFKHVDLVKLAGGAKELANLVEGEFTVDQIELSSKLHKTKLVILQLHMDCGGFGGSAAFSDDREIEFQHHSDVLKNARDFVRSSFAGIEIECYIADFDGLYRIV